MSLESQWQRLDEGAEGDTNDEDLNISDYMKFCMSLIFVI